VFEAMQAEERVAILEEYELFLREHVENTRAGRIAAMAPSHAQWAAIIRQQNALHRQLERKIRLLEEMQERRRRQRREPGPGEHPSSGEEGSRNDPTPPLPESPISPRPLGGEGPGVEGVQASTAEQSKNRGNEAKNSLKTNEVTPTNCANPGHPGARKARNEARGTVWAQASRRCLWGCRRQSVRIRAKAFYRHARKPFAAHAAP